jgi:hypothetical protein
MVPQKHIRFSLQEIKFIVWPNLDVKRMETDNPINNIWQLKSEQTKPKVRR